MCVHTATQSLNFYTFCQLTYDFLDYSMLSSLGCLWVHDIVPASSYVFTCCLTLLCNMYIMNISIYVCNHTCKCIYMLYECIHLGMYIGKHYEGVCVCIYECLNLWIYLCMYIHTLHMCMHTYMHMYAHMRKCIGIYVGMYLHCRHSYKNVYIYVCMYICMYVYRQIYMSLYA